jgi:transposase-like protein
MRTWFYTIHFPQASECLEAGVEDTLQFYTFPEIDHRKIATNNTLERMNLEIRRRSRVVGIFPSIGSYIRLISSYLIEYEDDWQTGRSYINAETLAKQRVLLSKAA